MNSIINLLVISSVLSITYCLYHTNNELNQSNLLAKKDKQSLVNNVSDSKKTEEKDDSCNCDGTDDLVALNSTTSLLENLSEEMPDGIKEGFAIGECSNLERRLNNKKEQLAATELELSEAKKEIEKLKSQISFVQGL